MLFLYLYCFDDSAYQLTFMTQLISDWHSFSARFHLFGDGGTYFFLVSREFLCSLPISLNPISNVFPLLFPRHITKGQVFFNFNKPGIFNNMYLSCNVLKLNAKLLDHNLNDLENELSRLYIRVGRIPSV